MWSRDIVSAKAEILTFRITEGREIKRGFTVAAIADLTGIPVASLRKVISRKGLNPLYQTGEEGVLARGKYYDIEEVIALIEYKKAKKRGPKATLAGQRLRVNSQTRR